MQIERESESALSGRTSGARSTTKERNALLWINLSVTLQEYEIDPLLGSGDLLESTLPLLGAFGRMT